MADQVCAFKEKAVETMTLKKRSRKRRKKSQEIRLKIEKQEALKEVQTKSMEVVRLSRVKYHENPWTFIDIRMFSRGSDDDGNDIYYPTRRGVQIKESDFAKLVDAHFLETLDKQIQQDPR